MIKWLRWHEYMMDWLTPKFDKVVGAVAGPLIGNIMGGGSDSGTSGYQQPTPQFTPYNITTPYGSSTFDTTNKTASYTLSPELQKFRDMYYKAATGAMPSAEQTAFANQVGNYGLGLFNNAANINIDKVASDYYNQQQNMLAPQRAQENTQLADTLFKTGRTGAGVGMTNTAGQTGYINPEQFSLLSARENQNAQLQMGAEDRARAIQNSQLANALNYYGQGQSLLTQPYNTANTLLGYGTGIENLGQNALTIGSNIGSNVANAQYQGGTLAANQQTATNLANAQNAAYWGNVGNSIGGSLGTIYKDAGGWKGIFGGNTNASPGINYGTVPSGGPGVNLGNVNTTSLFGL